MFNFEFLTSEELDLFIQKPNTNVVQYYEIDYDKVIISDIYTAKIYKLLHSKNPDKNNYKYQNVTIIICIKKLNNLHRLHKLIKLQYVNEINLIVCPYQQMPYYSSL